MWAADLWRQPAEADVAEDGGRVGREGSERGAILRGEESDAGARITPERGCAYGIPFAVTCGIYGWSFHTRLLGG